MEILALIEVNETLLLVCAAFGVIGIITVISGLCYLISWPFLKLSEINKGQDDILDDLEEIKGKLESKAQSHKEQAANHLRRIISSNDFIFTLL